MEIIHDNGNFVCFADGTVVSRQNGTVTHPTVHHDAYPSVVTLPVKGQDRHFDIAMGYR